MVGRLNVSTFQPLTFNLPTRIVFPYFLQGATLGFSASVSPGPFQAYLLTQATTHGWKNTWPAAFAPLLSDGPIILIVLLVLSQAPAWFLPALNFAGGIFLLYLAYGALRTFRTFEGQQSENLSEHSIFKAVLMNMLSPGPWIYWSVLAGPLLVKAWGEAWSAALAFLFGFYVMLIGGNALFIFLAATTRRFGPNVTRWLNGAAAIVLVIFGLLQLWRALSVA